MGYEVEIKYRDADHAGLAAKLAAIGAVAEGPEVEHEDAYLAHPSRDFAATGEALRIRAEGASNVVTYKGSKLGGPAKTREEIEVEFADGVLARGEMARVFDRLGFRPVAVVRKFRTSYRVEVGGRALTVTLDRAEGLGDFAEVEALAGGEADLPAAQGAVLDLAARLGLVEVEPRSYLRMVLEAGGSAPRNPRWPDLSNSGRTTPPPR